METVIPDPDPFTIVAIWGADASRPQPIAAASIARPSLVPRHERRALSISWQAPLFVLTRRDRTRRRQPARSVVG